MQVEDEEDSLDDPVVRTLDVFLSQNLPGTRDSSGRSDGVFLFQYPLRPKWQPLEEGWALDKVSYRPQHQMVELEMISNGFSEDDEAEFRHKLVSSSVVPKATYAIGLLRGEQVHLTPLQAVLQFRPRFDHKDDEDAAKKKAAAQGVQHANEQDAMDEGDEGSDGEPVLSQVHVRVTKRESDRAKEIRRSSHAYMREQEEKEPWKVVTMHPPDSEETEKTKELLVSNTSHPIDFSVSRKDYLASLNAVSKSRDDGVPAQTLDLSREKLETMTLREQVVALMGAAQALHFSRLLELIPNGMNQEVEVLTLLPEAAHLVHGCWVVKSEIVYKDEASGRATQIIESLRRCRDHVLSHFHASTRLTASSLRKEIVREVTPAMLESMLFQLATRKEGAWEFRLAPDSNFAEVHRDVVEEQDKAWAALEASISQNKPAKQTQQHHKAGNVAGGARKSSFGEASTGPSGGTGGTGGGGSAPALGAQARELIVGLVTKMIKETGVVSKQDVLDAVRGHANARVQEASAEAVMAALQGTVLVLHGGLVLKKLGGAGDTARTVVIDMFQKKPQLKKADILASVRETTGQDVAPTAFTKILKELAVAKGNHWIFKTVADQDQ